MIISLGPARPTLVPLAFNYCCYPLLLCCLLMLTCGLLADSVHAKPRETAGFPRSANGKHTSNFTEITEDGRRYQIIKRELVQGGSNLYQQVEYHLPAPGPHLLILVNFTRIDSYDTPAEYEVSENGTSIVASSNDSSTAGYGGSVLHELSTKSQPSKAPADSGGSHQARSRSGSRQPSSESRGRDMLAVGEIRRQRLHHSEGGQLNHKQPVDPVSATTAASHTSDAVSVNKLQASSYETSASASAKDFHKVRTQWPEYTKLNETAFDGQRDNFSAIAKLFPSSVKATESQYTSAFSTLHKANQSTDLGKHNHSTSIVNDKKYPQETLVDHVDVEPFRANAAVEHISSATSPPKETSFTSSDRRSNSVSPGGSPQAAGGSETYKDGLTAKSARDSPNKISRLPHSKRILKQTFVKNPTVVSTPPIVKGKDLSSSSPAKSFSARDLLGQLSPTLRVSGRDVDLTTRVPDHTEYFQLSSPEVDPNTSQDCSLKVIIEEADPSVKYSEEKGVVHRGLKTLESRREGKRRAQPQVICWQASLEKEGQPPRVYRYTTPLKITYLWSDKKPGRLLLKFRLLSLDEVECHFQCSTTPYLCLVRQQLCDGYIDCPDHSDELPKVCDSALNQGSTDKGSKVPSVIVSVVIPCGFVFIIFIVFLMIKHKLLGHSARRSGDSLLSPPPSHSSEACRSSQDSGQNEALLPDRPPPYSHLQQEQQHQQHQHLLTYTSGGVVSSLEPVQVPPAQHRQYLLPQQQQQQKQHHSQYQQLQHPNNNISGHNINNNDLSGAVSYHQQQAYQLPQQQQHMLLQQSLQSQSSNNRRDAVDAQQSPSSSLVFSGNGSNTASSHDVGGFQRHLYNNPLSNREDGNNQGNNTERYYSQHPHPLHHQHQQKNQSHQRQAKHPQPITTLQATPEFQTMSVLPPPQQQCPPHIPVSLDGEEGYSAAQRSLHSKRQMEQNLEAEYGIFRAPPNRSALERDSPPPPYSVQPPSTTGFSLDSLLSGSYFSSCPTSFTSSSSSQSPGNTRGGRGRGGGGHSQGSSSSHNCASSAPTNRH